MFFIIKGLTRMDNMYQYSLAVFFRIFGQVMNLPSKMMNVLLQMMNSVENDDISVKNDECLGQALKSPASNSSPEQRIAMLGEELLQVILSLLLIYQSPACFTDLVAGLLIVLTAVQLFYAYVSR